MAASVDNEVIWGIDVRGTRIMKGKSVPLPVGGEKREKGTYDYDRHLHAFHGLYLVRLSLQNVADRYKPNNVPEGISIIQHF